MHVPAPDHIQHTGRADTAGRVDEVWHFREEGGVCDEGVFAVEDGRCFRVDLATDEEEGGREGGRGEDGGGGMD